MTTTTTQDVVEHRDAMLDVFTEITQDCQLLGLMPIGVHVNQWSSGNLSADVHFSGQDVTAVNSLAATYGDLPETYVGPSNFGRQGRVDLDGRRVQVTVYTGRPEVAATPPPPTAPALPAGYAPQAVEEQDEDTCTECGREVSRPGRCFDCDVEGSYVGGLAPRFGAQP